jgi:hypothetical protein
MRLSNGGPWKIRVSSYPKDLCHLIGCRPSLPASKSLGVQYIQPSTFAEASMGADGSACVVEKKPRKVF